MKEHWCYQLTESDSYHFECSCCGECCRGDMFIPLSIGDLSRMLDYLKLESSAELFDLKYIGEKELDNGGFRPYIIFKGSPFKSCQFLENRLMDDGRLVGLCRLHPVFKPLVCHLAPIGRELIGHKETLYFTEPISGCPGCKVLTSCSVEQVLSAQREKLEVEKCYFLLMDKMQSKKIPMNVYRSFHRDLKRGECLMSYINRWKSSVL